MSRKTAQFRLSYVSVPTSPGSAVGQLNGFLLTGNGEGQAGITVFPSQKHGVAYVGQFQTHGDEDLARNYADFWCKIRLSALPSDARGGNTEIRGDAARRIATSLEMFAETSGEGQIRVTFPRLLFIDFSLYLDARDKPDGVIGYMDTLGNAHLHVFFSREDLWQILRTMRWLSPTMTRKIKEAAALSPLPTHSRDPMCHVIGYAAFVIGIAYEHANMAARTLVH